MSRISLIHSDELAKYWCYVWRISPDICKHAIDFYNLFISLCKECGVLGNCVEILEPSAADFSSLILYHSKRYISKITGLLARDSRLRLYGLRISPKDLPKLIIGSSIRAAERLLEGDVDVVVNAFGGYADAPREAPGAISFVNDVASVLLYLKRVRGFRRIALLNFSPVDLSSIVGDGNFLDDSDLLVIDLHFEHVQTSISGHIPYTEIKLPTEELRLLRLEFHIPLTAQDDVPQSLYHEVLIPMLYRFRPQITVIVNQGFIVSLRDPLLNPLIKPETMALIIADMIRHLRSLKSRALILGPGSIDFSLALATQASLIDAVCGSNLYKLLLERHLESMRKSLRSMLPLILSTKLKSDKETLDYVQKQIERFKYLLSSKSNY